MSAHLYLWQCPHCRREHGLCWMKTKSGPQVKSVLGVNCDDSFRVHHTRFVRIPKEIIEVSDIDEKRLELIPVFWTAPARAKEAATQNYGLPLMHTQPGQQVERNVELPRAQVEPSEMAGVDSLIAAQIASDDIQAKRILGEIEQCKQAHAEVQDEIVRLVSKRTHLENRELNLRAELREFWTAPLDFGDKPDAGS